VLLRPSFCMFPRLMGDGHAGKGMKARDQIRFPSEITMFDGAREGLTFDNEPRFHDIYNICQRERSDSESALTDSRHPLLGGQSG